VSTTKRRELGKSDADRGFVHRVDSLDWAREEIATTTRLIDEERVVLNSESGNDKYPAESAAFIQFNQQIAAHMFVPPLSRPSRRN
jgi:hypothetical protein